MKRGSTDGAVMLRQLRPLRQQLMKTKGHGTFLGDSESPHLSSLLEARTIALLRYRITMFVYVCTFGFCVCFVMLSAESALPLVVRIVLVCTVCAQTLRFLC